MVNKLNFVVGFSKYGSYTADILWHDEKADLDRIVDVASGSSFWEAVGNAVQMALVDVLFQEN